MVALKQRIFVGHLERASPMIMSAEVKKIWSILV
jgi:hypothetical protein